MHSEFVVPILKIILEYKNAMELVKDKVMRFAIFLRQEMTFISDSFCN